MRTNRIFFPLVLLSATFAAAPAEAASSRDAIVVAEIDAANAALPTDVRAEKYDLMKVSPFSFYRGSNQLFWMDFGDSALLDAYGGTSETRTFLGGDMHVGNTGAFDDDQGDVVFGVNDFDEAVIGDYQLDVFRMATSLLLVARENGVFNAADEEVIVDAFGESYLDTMAGYAGNSGETTKKFTASNTYGLLDNFLFDVEASESRVKMLDKWTVKVNGVRTFDVANNPDLGAVSASVAADIEARMVDYRATLSGGGAGLAKSFFEVKSIAARLHAGTGSLGSNRYYVLIEGDSTSQGDDRILDVKAQGAPSAWAYIDPARVAETMVASGGNMAKRAVLAYKAQGYRVDDLLGWVTLGDGQSYSVRERSPYKESFPTEDLTSMTRFINLAEQWGAVLATHHARADKDWDSAVFPASLDSAVDARTDGDHAGFRALLRAVAIDYADQVEYDYLSFCVNY